MNIPEIIAVALKVLSGRKTVKQGINFIKYKLSSPAERLDYLPTVLCVSATDRCNLKCDMCLTHSGRAELNPFKHRSAPDIDYELFRRVADRFETALSLQLIGTGEPLLNRDFFRMVEYAATKKKMDLFTTSNGTLLPRYMDEIINSSLTGINISLNGHTAEEFHRLTGEDQGKHQKIRDNILALTARRREEKSKLHISVSYILDQHNYPFMEEMLLEAEKLGVDQVWFGNYLSSVKVAGYSTEDRSLFSDMEAVKKVINKVKAGRFKVKYELPVLLNRKAEKRCRVYFTHIRVDGNGEVGACGRMLLNLSGNGHFDDPDVWNNDYFRKMRSVYLTPGVALPAPCELCPSNTGEDI
ncbi:MAG: radical SAM/SPASM domain-containing protein [bacterium]